MPYAFATLTTCDGPFSLIATDRAIIASGWTDDPVRLLVDVHPDLLPTGDFVAPSELDAARLGTAAVEAYYGGEFEAVIDVPVLQKGGGFRMRAWEELRKVSAGFPVTYGELAMRAGSPRASRAAGSACAHNSVALFVPCHRVVAAGPCIGGFGFRPELKAALLDREGWDGQSTAGA